MEANNMAAMREALVDTVSALESILEAFSNGTSGPYMADVAETIDNANAALAKRSRNCDVGTSSEQYKRFLKYCKKNTGGCDRADRYANPCAYCFSQWAQTPYEEGGAR